MSLKTKSLFLLLGLLSRCSPFVVQSIGGLIGQLLYWVPNKEQRHARINIEICFPELSVEQRQALVRETLIENAKTMLEMPVIWQSDPERWLSLVQEGEGEALLQSLLQQGKGVILAGPHLGAWEIAGLRLATIGPPLTTLYRPPRYEAIRNLMFEGRSRTGAKLVPTDAQGIKALYQGLKRGEMVAVLPDQQPKSMRGGVFAPFFGEPALTMDLIPRMARKSGAPVLFTFVERLPGRQGYRQHWLPAPEGIADPDPEVAVAALNQGVERCVRLCPQQYQWTYKRFRTLPDGSSRPYA